MAKSSHALHDYYAYENRDQAACPFMQNAAVQQIFCTELDTCDKYPDSTTTAAHQRPIVTLSIGPLMATAVGP